MGGVAAATLVPIAMGSNPLFCSCSRCCCGGSESFLDLSQITSSGFIAPIIEKKLPVGINIIAGALVIAPVARIIVTVVDPGVHGFCHTLVLLFLLLQTSLQSLWDSC